MSTALAHRPPARKSFRETQFEVREEAILDATRNEPLRKSIEVLNEMAQPIRYALLASRFEKSSALGEHEQIIGLLERGDLAAAADAIEQHVLRNIDSASGLYRTDAPAPQTTAPGKR